MRAFYRSSLTFIVWSGYSIASLIGCSPTDDPPFYQAGGSASDGPSGGWNSDSGGAKAGGGSTTGGAEGQTGGSGAGGEKESGGGSGGEGSGGDAAGGASTGGAGTGGGGSGATTCDGECRLEWPLRGEVSRDWTVSNYVDLDSGPGILDFQGGERSYNGHLGVDIAIASFRTMDQGIPIYAVAPGVVTAVHDGEFDRNTIAGVDGCTAVANIVYMTHVDGREARYLHFRKDSIVVEVGEEIAAGQKLGEVGSSGCSHSPHLHLELYEEPSGELIDPFKDGHWLDPPDYDAPPKVMEVILIAGGASSVEAIQTAPPSPSSFPAGYNFGIAVITGGTRAGAVEQITFYRNNAYGFTLSPFTFDGTERHYMRWWEVSTVEGDWRADVSLDGEVVESVEFVAE